MADEVQFTDEQWEAVATAAEVFAEVLSAAQTKLNGLLQSNWAGACAEGEGTIENLRALLTGGTGSFSHAMISESDYLKSVAMRCRAAKSTLVSIDETESESEWLGR